jgi:predicted RNA binding protein YcfA (HicA-like mRNA interferase family)
MVRFLEQQGFSVIRIQGGHHILVQNVLRTNVPVHGTRTLKIGALRDILRNIDMTPEKFAERWEQS